MSGPPRVTPRRAARKTAAAGRAAASGPTEAGASAAGASSVVTKAPRVVAAAGAPWPPALAARLAKIGLQDALDCVLHLPLRYEDETRLTPLAGAHDGDTVQLDAIVRDHTIQFRPRRQLVVQVDEVPPARAVADGAGGASAASGVAPGGRSARPAALTLRFFHFYGSQVAHFAPGTRLRVRGELRGGGFGHVFGREMVHPQYRMVDDDTALPDRLTPVYPTGVGLGQTVLRRAVGKALDLVRLDETVPDAVLARHRLPPIDAAIRLLHNPPPDVPQAALSERSHPAWQRVKFDELLAQQLSLARAHAARRARTAPSLAAGGTLVERFLARLPFVLTDAQARVVREIEADLARPHPMQRLLQGDVGSGKTVVAAIAALRAIDAGYQAVLMAPTEILAEQHFRKLAEWIEALDVPVAWLTGSLTKKQKASARDAIEGGIARLAIGTHALIQEDVHFARLGLAIVDEQHRFGVGQRLALRFKARAGGPRGAGDLVDASSPDAADDALPREPHQLMMSATPIPRTLAMTYFADLDVSTIDALPPGRQPIVTKLVDAARRDEVIERVRGAVAEGRQVYWVCPLVEQGAGDERPIDDPVDGEPSDARRAAGKASGGEPGAARSSAAAARKPGAASTARIPAMYGEPASAERRPPVRGGGLDRLALQAAVETRDALAAALPDVVVGLVHGRLSPADKADAMRRFDAGETDLLVATTVVEVGVDVPNASLMVIEHAERFGLAQLHQLRGRVGRGADESVCILLFQPPLSATAKARLKTMRETQDGFAIARKDLELRGPGEFLGHRQSGDALLRFADLQLDEALVDAARETAVAMLAGDPAAVDRHLERWLRGGEELLKA